MEPLHQLTNFLRYGRRLLVLPLLIGLMALGACSGEVVLPTLVPTFIPTITPTPIVPTPTPDPASLTPTPEPNAAFGDINFTYNMSVTSNLTFTVESAVPASVDTPFWEDVPEFVNVTFVGYPHTDSAYQPLIQFYSIPDFATDPAYADIFLSMRELLNARALYMPEGIRILPLSFQAQGAQVMQAQVQYLEMANGEGIRFLTQYQSTAGLINNFLLLYVFQGITDDGTTYVAGVLPVSSPILPNDGQVVPSDIDAFVANLSAYRENTVLQLNAEPVYSFTPNLDALDALFRSILISTPEG